MFNNDDDDLGFTIDPYDLLVQHENKINEVIHSHNNLVKLAEDLAKHNTNLLDRTERLEEELNRVYLYIGEHLY